MTTGHDIACAARSWLGTRFHHQGRLKAIHGQPGGVDCLGLLVGVATELELKASNGVALSSVDEQSYPHYPDSAKLQRLLGELLIPINKQQMAEGDIALFVIDESPRHLGIIANGQRGLSVIHAYAPARGVVEHALDSWWYEKIAGIYRIT